MKEKIQQWHDRLCEEFLKGNVPLMIFLEMDYLFDLLKSNPLYKINEN